MSVISKPFTFSAGASIIASEHNSNFDTIYSDYNGNITNANISASAAISDTKLATISTSQKVNTSALVSTSQTGGLLIYTSSTTAYSTFSMGTSPNAFIQAGPTPTLGYPKGKYGGSIPASTTLTIPPLGNIFLITGGTTDITGISIIGSDKEGVYMLITQTGRLTFCNGTTLKMSGALDVGNFQATKNDTISFLHDGVSNFIELTRSSNAD